MDATTLGVAVAGLAATAAAPWVQAKATARIQREAWQRDAMAQVYADAFAYAEDLLALVDRATDPFPAQGTWKRVETAHKDAITARLRLFAPASVVEAWIEVRDAADALNFNIAQDYIPGQPYRGLEIGGGGTDLGRASKAATALYEAARASFP